MRIRTTLVLVVLLAVGGLCLPNGDAAPDGAWSLADRIPDTAWGYVAIEDVGSWGPRLEQTAIYKLFSHPDMETFLAPIMQGLEQMIQGGGPMQNMPPAVQELLAQLANLKGDLAVAVLGIEQTRGIPMMVAGMDFGENAAQFGEKLKAFQLEVDPNGEHIREETKDGRKYWHMDAEGMPITATVFDSAFLVSNDEAALAAVIAGSVETPLSANASFKHVRAKAGGDDLALFGFANVPPLADMLKQQLGERELAMANSAGLDTVRGLGFGIAFAGDGFRDSLIIHAPKAEHGIMSLMRLAPYSAEALKWVPAGAFYYAESKANYDSYLANIRTLMGSIDPSATEGLDEMMGQIKTHLGIDIEKDLLSQLEGSICSYAALPATGGLYPEFAVMLKAKDGDAFEASMKRLVEGAAGVMTEEGDIIAAAREMKFRDHTLHLLEMEGARRRKMVPFTPTWTRLQGNWFAITLVPHTMKEIVLRATSTAEPGLADQEDFQAVLAAAPEGTGSISYIDLQAVMTLLYDTGVPMLQTLLKPNMMGKGAPPLDFAALPPTRVIRPFFRSMGMYASWNDEGMAISTYGPIPVGGVLMIAAIGAGVFAVSGRSMNSSDVVIEMPKPPMGEREPTEVPSPPRLGEIQRSIAEMQARDLARQIRIYVLEHAKMPATLNDLIAQEQIKSIPNDPWNHPFQLVVTDAEKKTFQVLSAGPDGQKGTKDDVLVDG